jgi:hypothetical protein
MYRLIPVILVLSGCATTYMPTMGGNSNDFAVANYRCQRESERDDVVAAQGSTGFIATVFALAAIGNGAAAASNYHACMAANGWVPQK